MPEGVSPASGVLQHIVASIFSCFSEWTICLFDNMLVCCTDYDDALKKLRLVLGKAIEYNVVLKFSKSYLGFPEANFFGYVVRKGSYKISEQRKQSVMELTLPTSLKKMQSFLGVGIFFKNFC